MSGLIVYKLFEEVKSYAENISKTVLDVSSTVSTNRIIVSDLSSAVAENSATISLLSDSTKTSSVGVMNSAKLAKEAESMATESFKLMQNSQHEISSLNTSIRDSEARLDSLDLEFQKINMIVQKINELSSDSGLLGLNASIEAANAGEFGRAFSVVANEIQNLSGQIKSLNGDVSEAVLGIQKAMNEMKHASGNNFELSNSASDGITQASLAFEKIKKLAIDVNKNNGEVLEVYTSQAGALGQINAAMKVVHNNGIIVSSGSEKTEENMKELSTVVGNLNGLI